MDCFCFRVLRNCGPNQANDWRNFHFLAGERKSKPSYVSKLYPLEMSFQEPDLTQFLPREEIELGRKLVCANQLNSRASVLFRHRSSDKDPTSYIYDDRRVMIFSVNNEHEAQIVDYKVLGVYDPARAEWTWAWADDRFSEESMAFSKALHDKYDYEIFKTPHIDLDGRSVNDLIYYVAHETGNYNDHAVRFVDDAVNMVCILFKDEDINPYTAS